MLVSHPRNRSAPRALALALALVFTSPCLARAAGEPDAGDETHPPLPGPAPRLSIGGIMAATYQWQEASGQSVDGGVVTIRPEIEFELSDRDLLHLTFALARGNGINDVSGFALSPVAKDVEQDLRDVNGSGRDSIQRLWYRRTMDAGTGTLVFTGGIIDSTEYLDQNAFANDEYTQFLNEAFVNAPVGFFPSYAPGVALEWADGPWSASGSVMRVSENDDGNDYVHAGVQVARTVENALGAGTYRLTVSWADDGFLDAAGQETEGRLAFVASADQMLSATTGAWARAGWQDDAAAVTHEWMISGGLDLCGEAWGRPADTAGIGLGWLEGGNGELQSTWLAEAYVRFALTDAIAFSVDAQYVDDDLGAAGGRDGPIFGLRLTYEF